MNVTNFETQVRLRGSQNFKYFQRILKNKILIAAIASCHKGIPTPTLSPTSHPSKLIQTIMEKKSLKCRHTDLDSLLKLMCFVGFKQDIT